MYDKTTAYYYAAYRPPLHRLILSHCLAGSGPFEKGLDIGCGTGQSSLALSEFCRKVVGLESSVSMIDRALKDTHIEYRLADFRQTTFSKEEFDIITMAGSLYYLKSQTIVDKITSISKDKAVILIYDYVTDLEELLSQLELEIENQHYDHTVNFSGLDHNKLKKLEEKSSRISLDISNENLIHLILSYPEYRAALSEKYRDLSPESSLLNYLNQNNKDSHQVWFDLYFCLYRIEK